jgi:hypothetical protein
MIVEYIRYEVARCAEDATAYTVRIEWDSASAK